MDPLHAADHVRQRARRNLAAEQEHHAEDHREAEHRVPEAVQAPAHQDQARVHFGRTAGFGEVDQDARQVERGRDPCHHEQQVKGLDPQIGHGVLAP